MLGMVAIAPKVGRPDCHCWRRRLSGAGVAGVNGCFLCDARRKGHALGSLPAQEDAEKRQAADQAGTRPPKNGIKAWLSVCGRLEVKIISAPAASDSPLLGLSKSETRRAIAGAGSIQSTGQGARAISRSIRSG